MHAIILEVCIVEMTIFIRHIVLSSSFLSFLSFCFFFFFFVFSNTILKRMFLNSCLKLSFIIYSLFINVLFIVFQTWDSAIPLVPVVLQDITHNNNNQGRLKRKLMSESMPTRQFPMTRIETTNQANLIKTQINGVFHKHCLLCQLTTGSFARIFVFSRTKT